MQIQIQEAVWALSEPDLTQLSELVARLLELRRKFGASSEQIQHSVEKETVTPRSSIPAPLSEMSRNGAAPLLARRPLRQPKPGSLRGDVHAVLQQAAKPMSRAEVSSRVAAKRRVSCDDALTNKVGEILRCSHDSRIQKLRHGIYRYAH